MKGFSICFVFLIIFNLVVGSVINSKEACKCESWAAGSYCGSRIGTGHLSGGCVEEALYQCNGLGMTAEKTSDCKCIIKSVGADQCSDPIPEPSKCKCNSWTVGKYCYFSTYLLGNCEQDALYRCDGYGLEALKSAKCHNCYEYGEGQGICTGGYIHEE